MPRKTLRQLVESGEIDQYVGDGKYASWTSDERERFLETFGDLEASRAVMDWLKGYRIEGNVLVRDLSVVEPKDPEWLWPGVVIKGVLNLLAGKQGLGKTFLALDLAARLSIGQPWPDGSPSEKGSALLLMREDSANSIRRRLDKLGADPKKIKLVEKVRTRSDQQFDRFTLWNHNLEQVADLIRLIGDVRLLVLDPTNSYWPRGQDSHKDVDIRRTLDLLVDLAEDTGVTVLATFHERKPPRETFVTHDDPIDRILGGTGITAVPRNVLGVCRVPGDPGMCLFGGLKCNDAPIAKTWEYWIDKGGLHWEGLSQRTIRAALGGAGESKQAKALQGILDVLRENNSCLLEKALRQAVRDRTGVSQPTYYRALEQAQGSGQVIQEAIGGGATLYRLS